MKFKYFILKYQNTVYIYIPCFLFPFFNIYPNIAGSKLLSHITKKMKSENHEIPFILYSEQGKML